MYVGTTLKVHAAFSQQGVILKQVLEVFHPTGIDSTLNLCPGVRDIALVIDAGISHLIGLKSNPVFFTLFISVADNRGFQVESFEGQLGRHPVRKISRRHPGEIFLFEMVFPILTQFFQRFAKDR